MQIQKQINIRNMCLLLIYSFYVTQHYASRLSSIVGKFIDISSICVSTCSKTCISHSYTSYVRRHWASPSVKAQGKNCSLSMVLLARRAPFKRQQMRHRIHSSYILTFSHMYVLAWSDVSIRTSPNSEISMTISTNACIITTWATEAHSNLDPSVHREEGSNRQKLSTRKQH